MIRLNFGSEKNDFYRLGLIVRILDTEGYEITDWLL